MLNRFNRLTVMAFLFASLTGLCFYGMTHPPYLSLETCLNNPGKYDGRTVTYISEPYIREIKPDGFLLQHRAGTIRVLSDTTGLRVNEYVGLVAVYHREGFLEARQIMISKNRRYKIIFSIFPVLLIAVLLLRHFKMNWKTIQIGFRNA
ncbi:hypothetical protein JW948_18000 [bacterium]|nr:hypothetical protein [bacterium]